MAKDVCDCVLPQAALEVFKASMPSCFEASITQLATAAVNKGEEPAGPPAASTPADERLRLRLDLKRPVRIGRQGDPPGFDKDNQSLERSTSRRRPAFPSGPDPLPARCFFVGWLFSWMVSVCSARLHLW